MSTRQGKKLERSRQQKTMAVKTRVKFKTRHKICRTAKIAPNLKLLNVKERGIKFPGMKVELAHLTVGRIQHHDKKWFAFSDLDRTKIKKLTSKPTNLMDMFDSESPPRCLATSLTFTAIIVLDGLHRLTALGNRKLKKHEQNQVVNVRMVLIPSDEFKKLLLYAVSLNFATTINPSASELFKKSQTVSSLEAILKYFRFVQDSQQVEAYMLYFCKCLARGELKENQDNERARKICFDKIWSRGICMSGDEDLFLNFCLNAAEKYIPRPPSTFRVNVPNERQCTKSVLVKLKIPRSK